MKVINKAIIGSSLMFLSAATMAADNIGARAEDLGDQINTISTVSVFAATLFGLIFMIVGGIQLKKHGDNPQQVPLAKPLIFLTAGALLFGLGSASDTMQATLFGGDGREEASGGTFDDFG